MIEKKDLLAFNFYKKEKFTGSYHGMRYLIQKAKEEDETEIFSVVTWPGPYNCASTAEELKVTKTFPFQEEALQEIADYLNEVHEKDKDSWPTGISV